jgi:SH3-like domain-containing protein
VTDIDGRRLPGVRVTIKACEKKWCLLSFSRKNGLILAIFAILFFNIFCCETQDKER